MQASHHEYQRIDTLTATVSLALDRLPRLRVACLPILTCLLMLSAVCPTLSVRPPRRFIVDAALLSRCFCAQEKDEADVLSPKGDPRSPLAAAYDLASKAAGTVLSLLTASSSSAAAQATSTTAGTDTAAAGAASSGADGAAGSAATTASGAEAAGGTAEFAEQRQASALPAIALPKPAGSEN